MRNHFDQLRAWHEGEWVGAAPSLVKRTEKQIKKRFDLTYFYCTEEVIAEARALGGHVVGPHPEQFWPILLENIEVGAVEVWNPAPAPSPRSSSTS